MPRDLAIPDHLKQGYPWQLTKNDRKRIRSENWELYRHAKNSRFSINAPIVDRFIQQIDRTVTEIATRQFIGARLLPTYKLYSEGVTVLDWWDLEEMNDAVLDVDGLTENDDSADFTLSSVRIPVIHKDFKMPWRDLAAARAPGDGGTNKPLDVANVQEATRKVLLKVDDTIFNGHSSYGIDGLTNASGRNTFTGADWATQGQSYEDVNDILAVLENAHHFGPYVGVVNPTQYAESRRVFGNTGIPQREAIIELLDAGWFRTPALSAGTGLFFSQSEMNADLVTATGGPQQMNFPQMKYTSFMIYDLTVPRIRRAASITTASSI